MGLERMAVFAASMLLLTASVGFAVPEIEIDTTEAIVTVPQGTVVTQSLNILNNGDVTLISATAIAASGTAPITRPRTNCASTTPRRVGFAEPWRCRIGIPHRCA